MNVRLDLELQARLEELQASRQRIVTALDAERRRLEPDIHDGAQLRGLTAAVGAHIAKACPEVQLAAQWVGMKRYAPEAEAGVYFCCLRGAAESRRACTAGA